MYQPLVFLNFISNCFRSRYLIRSLIVHDLKSRYVGSFLGLFWSIIHPVAQLVVYYFIFSIILKTKLGPAYGETGFAFWLVAGLLPWLFLSEVVTRSPHAVLEQSSLLTKIAFPAEVLPFAYIGAALVNHVIGIMVLIIFLLIVGDGISWQILYLIPAQVILSVFVMGIAWMLSALNVFFRDVGQVTAVFVNIWFFLTPVIYPQHLVPDSLQKLYALNPAYHIVAIYRTALLGKTTIDPAGAIYFIIAAMVSFVIGGVIFKRLKPALADEL